MSAFVVSHQLFSVPPTGLVSHSDLDDRAIEALKEFNEEGALQVLLQFKDSDLSHVQVCVSQSRCCLILAKIIILVGIVAHVLIFFVN